MRRREHGRCFSSFSFVLIFCLLFICSFIHIRFSFVILSFSFSCAFIVSVVICVYFFFHLMELAKEEGKNRPRRDRREDVLYEKKNDDWRKEGADACV